MTTIRQTFSRQTVYKSQFAKHYRRQIFPLYGITRSRLSISEGLLFIRELTQLIKWSPKRHALFETLKLEDSPHLRTLSPTRWAVRNEAIDAVLKNYGVLCKTFNEISESGRDEYALKANGLLHTMEKFSTYLA